MALKDWKLIVNIASKKHWENQLEDEKEIVIMPRNLIYNEGWTVSWIEPNYSSYRLSTWKNKYFTTKSGAIKFAKNYMRRN